MGKPRKKVICGKLPNNLQTLSHPQLARRANKPRLNALACRSVNEPLRRVFLSRFKEIDELVNSLSSLVSMPISASFVHLSMQLVSASIVQFFYDYSRYMYKIGVNRISEYAVQSIDAANLSLLNEIKTLYLNLTNMPESLEQNRHLAHIIYEPVFGDSNLPLSDGTVSLSVLEQFDSSLGIMVRGCAASSSIHLISTAISLYLVLPILTLLLTNRLNEYIINPISRRLLRSAFRLPELSRLDFNDRETDHYAQVDDRLGEIRQKRAILTPIVNSSFFALRVYLIAMLAYSLVAETNFAPVIRFDGETNDFWMQALYIISVLLGLMCHHGYFKRDVRNDRPQIEARDALIEIFSGMLSKDAVEMIETEVLNDTMYCISVENIKGVDSIKVNFSAFMKECNDRFTENDIDILVSYKNHQFYVTYSAEIKNQKAEIKKALDHFVTDHDWQQKPSENAIVQEIENKNQSHSYFWNLSLFDAFKSRSCHKTRGKRSPDTSRSARPMVKPKEPIIVKIGGYYYNDHELEHSTMFPLDVGNRGTGLSHFGVLSDNLCDGLQTKFLAQLRQGTRGTNGKAGIRYLGEPKNPGYPVELKITGTDARCFGREEKHAGNKTLVIFDKFESHSAKRSAFRA